MPMAGLTHKQAKCHSWHPKLSGSATRVAPEEQLVEGRGGFELSPMAQEALQHRKVGTESSYSVMPHWPGGKHGIRESLRLE